MVPSIGGHVHRCHDAGCLSALPGVDSRVKLLGVSILTCCSLGDAG